MIFGKKNGKNDLLIKEFYRLIKVRYQISNLNIIYIYIYTHSLPRDFVKLFFPTTLTPELLFPGLFPLEIV